MSTKKRKIAVAGIVWFSATQNGQTRQYLSEARQFRVKLTFACMADKQWVVASFHKGRRSEARGKLAEWEFIRADRYFNEAIVGTLIKRQSALAGRACP